MKPAIIRSVVVLPQPDGPSSETNSPSPNASVASLTAYSFLAVALAEPLQHQLAHASGPPPLRRALGEERLHALAEIGAHVAHQDQVLALLGA